MGKDRARVDMGDIEKLDEGEFLNDNLIVFYLRWLQDQLEQQHPEWAKRIYFQNTFFYQKLSNPEKGMKGINYEAVKKWTSKVDLLSKDYIIIPINEHSHWYVAIICNAPKLLPGGETTDHSQSQDINELPEDEGTNAETGPKFRQRLRPHKTTLQKPLTEAMSMS
jgi:Ulp1 family protease